MEKRIITDTPIKFDSGSFFDLVSLSVGGMVCRQTAMGELVIGGSGWNVDVKQGTIKFADKLFKSGILGSESDISHTWLWGWANTESGLPEAACAPSRRAKRAAKNVEEFQTGKFMLDELHSGHNISMVCCGLSEKNVCYYRCPYTDGAVFVMIEGLPEEVFAPIDRMEFMKQYLDIIRGFYCDHRLMAAGFLYMNGTEFKLENDAITAEFPDGALEIKFEEAGGIFRTSGINTMISPNDI